MTSKAEQPSAPHLQDPAVSEDIDTGRMRAVHGAKYSVCDLYRVLWEHEGEGLLKGESARKCRGTGTWAESKGMSLPNIKCSSWRGSLSKGAEKETSLLCSRSFVQGSKYLSLGHPNNMFLPY